MKRSLVIPAGLLRPATVLLTFGLFAWLLVFDAQRTFPATDHSRASFLLSLIQYGFSALLAFTYLAVGALVWLYIRHRLVGVLMFAFSVAMMVSFSGETGSVAGDFLVTTITATVSPLALYLFAVLLLLFPHNYFSGQARRNQGRQATHRRLRAPSLYLALLTIALLLSLALNLPFFNLEVQHLVRIPAIPDDLGTFSDLFTLLGILGTLYFSYRRSSSLRNRQQVRLIATGILLAVIPFLVLTLVPMAFVPANSDYSIHGQFTTLTFGLIPVALGYSILRYHVLVVDRHIRSSVTLLVGGICLAVAAYLVIFFCDYLLSSNAPMQIWSAALAVVLLIPLVWRIAPAVTDRLFAPDLASVHRLLYEESQAPGRLRTEADTLEAVARLLIHSARTIFGTPRVCFLTYHKESASYRAVAPAEEAGDGDASYSLLSQMMHAIHGKPNEQTWLDARGALFTRLAGGRRPLFLSEALQPRDEGKTSRRAQFLTASALQEDPLLVPVRTRGSRTESEMVGILVLGARENDLAYAGPDFAAIDLLLICFSGRLETALVDTQATQHVAMLSTLCGTTTVPTTSSHALEALAEAYAHIVANAVQAGAEIWLYDQHEGLLRRAVHSAFGPPLPYEERIVPHASSGWHSWFYEHGSEPGGGEHEQMPPSILEPPDYPFAWLPLLRRNRPLGVLVVTYPPPRHLFSAAERQILEMFAHQTALAFENAQIAQGLHAAAAKRREQDRLKEQEVRTYLQHLLGPLVALQRYVGLLHTPQRDAPSLPDVLVAFSSSEGIVPLPGEPLAPTLFEMVARLAVSTQESLNSLGAKARKQANTTAPDLDEVVRAQVNSILSEFTDERLPVALVITPDPDFRALLASALGIAEYAPTEVASCPEAVEWARQSMRRGAPPAVVLLDSSALGASGIAQFTSELQAVWNASHLSPSLLLLDSGNTREAWWPTHYTLETPFTIRDLLEKVRLCIKGSPEPEG